MRTPKGGAGERGKSAGPSTRSTADRHAWTPDRTGVDRHTEGPRRVHPRPTNAIAQRTSRPGDFAGAAPFCVTSRYFPLHRDISRYILHDDALTISILLEE